MTELVLRADGLRIETERGAPIVESASFGLDRGEVLGIVGESGSGKTTTALALLGFAADGVRIAGGTVTVAGRELTGRPEAEIRPLRGSVISYVPQDPSVALNPSMRVGTLIGEILRTHAPDRNDAETVRAALRNLQLPADDAFLRRFPHQLSGGQQQRLAIAMALAAAPAVAVLDEPTTGLDVVTQARVLEEVKRLREASGISVVYVSHDLAVVAGIADRIAVMYAGSIVEIGSTSEILHRPRHPYTHGLISSIPDHAVPRRLRGIPGVAVGVGERPTGCRFAPRCPRRVEACETAIPALLQVAPGHDVRCIRAGDAPPVALEAAVRMREAAPPILSVRDLRAGYRSRAGEVVAADGVSFDVRRGECVALVGESGSGKTTIARVLVGLHKPDGGRIELDGRPLAATARARSREERRRLQVVFQNPYDSLNPRQTVETAIAGPLRFFGISHGRPARVEVAELLAKVRLPERLMHRYPAELSGGERQRVAIARALAAGPSLLVCDEITSALDVSVQAAVLEVLSDLRKELGLALIFISHDLGVVASISDRLLVLDRGRLCESGPVDDVLRSPEDPYTRRLLDSAPTLPVLAAHVDS